MSAGGRRGTLCGALLACLALCWSASGPLALALSVVHGDLDRRIEALDRALAAPPDDPHERALLHACRAELLRQHDQRAEAREDLRRARALAPGLGPAALVEARLLVDEGALERASRVLARASEALAEDLQAARLAAEVLEARGLLAEAEAAYQRALTLASEPELFVARARVCGRRARAATGLVASRHLARALAGLDEGLARLGPVPALVLEAVALERERGAWDAALERLARAASVLAPEALARAQGDVQRAAGRPAAARAAYRRALGALGALPPERRGTPACRRLAIDLRAALAALEAGSDPEPPEAPSRTSR